MSGLPFLAAANAVETLERLSAEALGRTGQVRIPTPTPRELEKLTAMGIRVGAVCERLAAKMSLSEAWLPEGWLLKQAKDPGDPRQRVIVDAAGELKATIFIKRSGYDNYAYLTVALSAAERAELARICELP